MKTQLKTHKIGPKIEDDQKNVKDLKIEEDPKNTDNLKN